LKEIDNRRDESEVADNHPVVQEEIDNRKDESETTDNHPVE
jgi:hypothetical protein